LAEEIKNQLSFSSVSSCIKETKLKLNRN